MNHLPKDRTAEAIALLALVAQQNATTAEALRDKGAKTRRPHLVKLRRDFCVRGRAIGLTTPELAIALNRHYSTISYHSSPELRANKLRKSRPSRMEARV
jgi:hypothetical protein